MRTAELSGQLNALLLICGVARHWGIWIGKLRSHAVPSISSYDATTKHPATALSVQSKVVICSSSSKTSTCWLYLPTTWPSRPTMNLE